MASSSATTPLPAVSAEDQELLRFHNSAAWAHVKALYPTIREEFTDEQGSPLLAQYRHLNPVVMRLGRLLPINQLAYNTLRRGGTGAGFQLGGNKRSNPSQRVMNLKAALVQATGRTSTVAECCPKCEKGHGLWQGCVRAPVGFPDGLLPDACANCMYSGKAANCKKVRTQPLASYPAGVAQAQAAAPAPPAATQPPSTAVAFDSATSDPAVRPGLADAVVAMESDAETRSSQSMSRGTEPTRDKSPTRDTTVEVDPSLDREAPRDPFRTPRRRRLGDGRWQPNPEDVDEDDENAEEEDEVSVSVPESLARSGIRQNDRLDRTLGALGRSIRSLDRTRRSSNSGPGAAGHWMETIDLPEPSSPSPDVPATGRKRRRPR